MRKQFVKTLEKILTQDPKVALLLADIGVFGFRKAFETFPDRVYNIGILEASTIGLAAGLAQTGFIPVVHTIAPFLVERAFEQLKVDFGYQKLRGNFVSVGASYDYAALGCTHHCPGDVALLKAIPNMEIILPGTAFEFNRLFEQAYANHSATYFRLSESSNPVNLPVEFGKAEVLKRGTEATVIAVGPALGPTLEAVRDLDVTLLYYTTLRPFDSETLSQTAISSRILLCEPYYQGALAADVNRTLGKRPHTLEFVGVPEKFLTHYGKSEDHDLEIGLHPSHIREILKEGKMQNR